MEESKVKKIYEILNNIPVTEKNKDLIEEIREKLLNKEYIEALSKIEELNNLKEDEDDLEEIEEEDAEEQNGIYPKELSNIKLEHIYM